jgi:serine/threonine protein kinase
MSKYGKWETIKELGAGGQGVVYMARNTELLDIKETKKRIARAHLQLVPTSFEDNQSAQAGQLAEAVLAYSNAEHPDYCGALKVLHSSSDPAEFNKQLDRMKQEVGAMRALSHPRIIRILDQNLEDRWFVTELFREGTLADNLYMHRGEFTAALLHFRPLVEAVAQMHGKNLVHRDIKPENIFLSSGKLVLGDLGLVYFADEKRTRISSTFENVGSRDWMPAWAMGMRLEDVRPSFDVFSLGKVLWSMVSGKPRLQLWYLHEERFELETMFPQSTDVRWARQILDRCIVERERDCLANAGELLRLVDTVLPAVRRHSQVIGESVPRICRACGLGHYNEPSGQALALQQAFRIFICRHCGHTEFFYRDGTEFPAWKKGTIG